VSHCKHRNEPAGSIMFGEMLASQEGFPSWFESDVGWLSCFVLLVCLWRYIIYDAMIMIMSNHKPNPPQTSVRVIVL